MSNGNGSAAERAMKEFSSTIAIAKKNKIKHFLKYGQRYENYYKKLLALDGKLFQEDVFLLEKLQQHTYLVKQMIELHAAMINPANEPRVDSKNILVKPRSLFQNANVKQLAAARAKAKEFIPLVKKVFAQACTVQLRNLNHSATDLPTLTYLADALNSVTALVKDKTKSPDLIESVVFQSSMAIMSKKMRKICLSHPRLVTFAGLLTMTVAAAIMIAGGMACSTGIGFKLGLPLIAAGAGLFFIGKKLKDMVPYYRTVKELDKRDLKISKFGEALEKIAHTKQTVDTYKDAEKLLKKVQPLYDNSATEELYSRRASKSMR
jgi:hypothetical protein